MLGNKRLIMSPLFVRLLFAGFSLSLLAMVLVTSSTSAAAHPASTPLQYVALGDSLPFGYQPNRDFSHSYPIDLFQTLQTQRNYDTLVNFSCSDDTSATFIAGDPTQSNNRRGCLDPQVQTSAQLSTAVAYLQQHASVTGLVTLQIGIDDFLNSGAIDFTNCAVNVDTFNTQLGIVDQNLTQTILPQLQEALSDSPARLVLVDYYNALQQLCPNTTPYIQTLNQHLRQDAHGYASFVDISTLFNTNNLCQLTWMCNDNPPNLGDIHPNNQGYALIADRIYQRVFCQS